MKRNQINHPDYYNQDGRPECIDEIKKELGLFGAVYFCQGNILKYSYRDGKKDGSDNDIYKSVWYKNKADELMDEIRELSAKNMEKFNAETLFPLVAEEFSELLQVLCKIIRKHNDDTDKSYEDLYNNLLEEIADCRIMLNKLSTAANIEGKDVALAMTIKEEKKK